MINIDHPVNFYLTERGYRVEGGGEGRGGEGIWHVPVCAWIDDQNI